MKLKEFGTPGGGASKILLCRSATGDNSGNYDTLSMSLREAASVTQTGTYGEESEPVAAEGSASKPRGLDDVFKEADVKPSPKDDIDVFENILTETQEIDLEGNRSGHPCNAKDSEDRVDVEVDGSGHLEERDLDSEVP